MAWFDELKNAPVELIREYHLNEMMEPVAWKYQAPLPFGQDLWQNLSQAFPYVWGASAFKGADGSRYVLNQVGPYLQFTGAW